SDAAHRLGIAHDQQSADLRALLLNKIQRDLDAPARGGDKLALRKRTPALERLQNRGCERRGAGEHILRRSAQKFAARRSQKRSTGALTSTTRESLVNSIRPSCKVDISWSTLSFSA